MMRKDLLVHALQCFGWVRSRLEVAGGGICPSYGHASKDGAAHPPSQERRQNARTLRRPMLGRRSSRNRAVRYLIRLMTLNMGRYRAMTANPTAPPMTKIMSGSMIEVSESTAVVTSSS